MGRSRDMLVMAPSHHLSPFQPQKFLARSYLKAENKAIITHLKWA